VAVEDRRAARHVAEFAAAYTGAVLDYVRALPADALDPVVDALAGAVAAGANSLYLFGNGGSHAIARHLDLALRRRFAGLRPLRINCAVDYHGNQWLAVSGGFDSIFEGILRSEGASGGDLGVLISGSGDSTNLLRAAAYCRANGVRTVSFAGFDGGRISRDGITDVPFVVRVHDQQISEDIVQVLLHAAAEATYRRFVGAAGSRSALPRYASRVAASLERLRPAFLERVGHSVCRAFLAGGAVYMLAPEGAPLSVSAEHTAHNLNWDAVFEVPHPPCRRLHSTPTHCDYSGIGNDRLAPGIVSCQQLDAARPGDVLVLYARDLASAPAQQVLASARSAGVTTFVVAGRSGRAETAGADVMVVGSDDPDVLADSSQIAGHILGRLVRMRLRQAVEPGCVIEDLTAYLVGGDLAQRRLIDVVPGL